MIFFTFTIKRLSGALQFKSKYFEHCKYRITLIEKKYKDNSTETSEETISDDKRDCRNIQEFLVNLLPNLKIPTSHKCHTDF